MRLLLLLLLERPLNVRSVGGVFFFRLPRASLQPGRLYCSKPPHRKCVCHGRQRFERFRWQRARTTNPSRADYHDFV
uniref:Putative secreted protein n=1 Tax=Anopheles triannulatus TaxID=58253 RepID=A0A2M4B5Y9_9DIPT